MGFLMTLQRKLYKADFDEKDINTTFYTISCLTKFPSNFCKNSRILTNSPNHSLILIFYRFMSYCQN